MFRLSKDETQEVVANCDHLLKLKYSHILPYAFAEYGAVMLASVLNSDRAIMVNIQIVRIFTKLRRQIETQALILGKIEELQQQEVEQNRQIQLIFDYLGQLELERNAKSDFAYRRRIGFRQDEQQ